MARPTATPDAQTNQHTNRLAHEASPYLLQHAHNPVDWHPWGDEAFAEARRRNVPIFLSIGYSTCYWCHVMERESFEDPTTARLMNERFVCVKVDREERPDVDDLYMAATVTLTGSGGWPMSVFLEPERLRPFYCGTYFPPEPRHGMPEFTRVLGAMADAFRDRRDEVIDQAQTLAEAVRAQLAEASEPLPVGGASIARAIRSLLQMFDKTNGGFGGSPKFPQPALLAFLLDARGVTDAQTRAAIDHTVRTTLDAMMLGGIHDQVGGGFHRYAVDQTWTVPHFEKMLYDNAQLLSLYARAARVYDDGAYDRVARRTARYMQREMTGPEGMFFSAQDAEVDGREGKNYLWNSSQLQQVLEDDDARFIADLYGVATGTNFRDPHHPDEPASNVLRLAERLEKTAERSGQDASAFVERVDAINERLCAARATREQPGLDDKIITSWNAMAIGAFVDAAEALGDEALFAAGVRAAEALLRAHDPGDGLLRSSRSGRAGAAGVLEDHATLAAALVRLADGAKTFGQEPERWLREAARVAERAIELFGADDGGFYDTLAGADDLFVRARSSHDGAVPSGVGVMLGVLIDLHGRTGDDAWLARAGGCLGSLSAQMAHNPVGAVNSTRQLIRLLPLRERAAALVPGLSFDEADQQPTPRGVQTFEVFADRDRVTVGPDAPAEVRVRVRVRPGFHILAAEADPDGELGDAASDLVPLRVGLVSGQGVAVYADYPAGEPTGVAGVGRVRAHEGEIELLVAIEHAPGVGVRPGRPVLGLTAQACSDRACERPTTVELDVAVDLVGEGDDAAEGGA